MKEQFSAALINHTTQMKPTFPAGIPANMHCTPVTTLGAFTTTQVLSPVYLPANFPGFSQQVFTNNQLFVSTPPTVVLQPNFQCLQSIPTASLTNTFPAVNAIEPVSTTNVEAADEPVLLEEDPNEELVITNSKEQNYEQNREETEVGSSVCEEGKDEVSVDLDSDASCEICPDTDNKSVDSVILTEKYDQFVSSESPVSENVEEEEEEEDEEEEEEEDEEDYTEEISSQNPSEVPVSPSGSEEIPDPHCNLDMCEDTEDGLLETYEEPDFVWEEYLQETGALEVPPTAFKHVECSLQSGFVKGMKLEVAVKSTPDTYWVASVIMTCGPLLRLRYDGYGDDGSADFWHDLTASEIHSIGWCAQNNKTLMPPDELKNKIGNWRDFLTTSLVGAATAPSYLLDKTTGTTPVDQIKQGMRLELQDHINPNHVWIVKVLENVGGRLYLRQEGLNHSETDFWLFYLNHLLHPIDWAKQNNYEYSPPKEYEDQYTKEEWDEIFQEALKEAEAMPLPVDIFKDQIEIRRHNFKAGWKLEAVNPVTKNEICPATVIDVVDDKYFIVEIDDVRPLNERSYIRFGCHIDSPGIFPAMWCRRKGIHLKKPAGWDGEFDWAEYLSNIDRKAAPRNCFGSVCMDVPYHQFQRGLKLEAVNPDNSNQICAATITKIVDRLMWIHLDNSSKMKASFIEDIDSHNLFPVGWCESNGYQLNPPRRTGFRRPHKQVAVVQPEPVTIESHLSASDTYNKIKNVNIEEDTWCPKIYYNHRCFSGPYLAKSRIAELPKSIGPGPIKLVMTEVLTMLINVAYKSSRVLRELQVDGEDNPNMHQQVLKAKYKGKSYRAAVELCRNVKQLDEFCRQICIKLECCPNLISPHCIDDDCPENCSQLTKTKYIPAYYYGKKKRKIGRPPGGHSNLENGPRKTGKRRKKRKGSLSRKSRSSMDDIYADDVTAENSNTVSEKRSASPSSENNSSKSDTKKTSDSKPAIKRKYTHHVPPRSEIHTRGAKLPKYSFERKTHKKILITPAPPSSSAKSLPSPTTEAALPITPISPKEEISIKKEEENDDMCVDILSNPLYWTVSDVVSFIKSTDCAQFARLFRQEEIDGQALLLLTLPTVQDHLALKLGPAIKLCHHIERVKIVFYKCYA
ncbi:scm-like with four MBT domains protein 1 isoform X1 [Octopus sinensis]|uniref:Scm-like with four MBT domains protein 1 isoform X1 n=1 Tax=Octopus sinensis TaxID=2607531 RepID=A0A7E6FE80_9MOLL|nr:scm-like with four MBT domains protein 1 isoform X1 [Octopus sinensis]